MSRWFRHYAGMARDAKLVAAALKSQQPVERVVWVWAAILESAAEIDDNGRFELDAAEAAYFLRAEESDVAGIVAALEAGGRVSADRVVKWGDRQFQSDRSAERQRRMRDRQKASSDADSQRHDEENEHQRDDKVTSPSRHRDAPDTETELDTSSLRSDVARDAGNGSRQKKGTRLPPDWQPSEEDTDYAVSHGVPRDKIPTLVEEYRNYWCARPGKDGLKLDWSATWRNRVLQVCDRNGWKPFGQPNSQAPPPTKTWVECDDPRWSSLAQRHREEFGKPLHIVQNRSKAMPGNYVPNDWLAH